MTLVLLWLACASPATDTSDTADTGGDTADTGADTADTAETGDTADSGVSAFEGVVFPIYEAKCAGCHTYWGADADALYAAWSDAGLALVVAGDRHASPLYDKVANEPPAEGGRMPLQLSYLDDDALANVADWIDAGAAKATFGNLYDQVFRARSCSMCHQEWGFSPDEVHESWLADEGAGALVVPGDAAGSYLYQKLIDGGTYGSRMPVWYPPLDAGEVEAIGAWIDAGATR